MRDFFKNLYRNTWLGKVLLWPYIYFRDHLLPEKTLAKRTFKRRLGYPLNLESPKTFNEKMMWLKLNDRTALHTQCADKYKVREYVAEKLGEEYLIPMVFQSYDAADLRPENFPDHPFIIKTNHDSSGGVIVRDKSEVNWPELRHDFAKKLKTNYFYGSGEWQYKNIRPCIVAENLLKGEDGGVPPDYKLFCFHGKVKYIQLDLDRDTVHKRNMYDTDWNLLEFKYLYENGKHLKKPHKLDEMIRLAEIVAKDFVFVRVDFYNIEDKVYFGEITFHPESGMGKFVPEKWDAELGELLTLPL